VSSCCDDPGGFDLAVIGAGSSGFAAAIAAAEEGARVLLVGHGLIGGTCVNVGCVPSKFLIRAAEAAHAGTRAHRFRGIRGHLEFTDWPALRAQKDALVAALRKAKYEDLLGIYPSITYLEGRARLTPAGVDVAGRSFAVPRIVITTGSRPATLPGVEIDEQHVLTSDGLLSRDRRPDHLLVIGAGAIGLELGQTFLRLGARVTVVEYLERILPPADPDISSELKRHLEAEGAEFRLAHRVQAVHARDGRVEVVATPRTGGREKRIVGDAVLVAVGRQPNTEGLGLEELGVRRDERGFIATDAYMRTSREGIYAAGDVTGRHMYVYMAAHGGRIAALNALRGDVETYDETAVPHVVFTDPQVAWVGLGEPEARGQGIDARVSRLPLDQLPRALAALDTRGLIKLVADAESLRLLGAHIVAPEGADAVQTAALALRRGMTAGELARTIVPYLTTVEGLKLAAQAFEKDPAKLSCCAG